MAKGTTTNTRTASAEQLVGSTAMSEILSGLKTAIDNAGGGDDNTYYCTCDTAASTAAKVITPQLETGSVFALKKGTIIVVSFTNTNTASNPTFNVASSGTVGVKFNGTVISSSDKEIGGESDCLLTYVYDGSNWCFVAKSATGSGGGGGDDNTYFCLCPTAAATAAKVITPQLEADGTFTLKKGTVIIVAFTYTNTAASPTFSVGGGSATAVKYNGAVITSSNKSLGGMADALLTYVYDGTNWCFSSKSVDGAGGGGGSVPSNVALLEDTDSSAVSPDFDSEAHTVHITAQTLTSAQQAQARTNIGAADASTVVNSTAIRNIVTISQADYTALTSKDNTTLYIIS